jgi:hypothetical protein
MLFSELKNGSIFKLWRDEIIFEKISPNVITGNNVREIYPCKIEPFEDWIKDYLDVYFLGHKESKEDLLKKT